MTMTESYQLAEAQEKAAKEWAARYHIMASEIATASYIAGWNYALESLANSRTADREAAEQAARQIERQDMKRKFLALASTAFLCGEDVEAKMYRTLANQII